MRKDWKIVRLEKTGQVVNGGTPKTNVAEYWDGEHLWVTPAEMGNKQTPYLAESRRKLTDAGLRNSSASLVPPQSIILSTRAPIGHLVINTAPMAFNQGCRAVIPNPDMHYKYLFYFLLGNVELLNDLGTGTTFKELSATKLKNVSVPLPPLSEQKRIVAILDEAFAGIATAVANTEKNLANARELFEGYLNSVFSQRGEGWSEVQLSDCAISVSTGPFGSLLHKSDYVSDGLPLVNPINIVESEIIPDEKKLISKETKNRLGAYILRKNDIVIGRRGEIGRCAVIGEDQDGWVCGTGCFFIRLKPEVNPHFLASMLRSDAYRTELELQATGATMKNLSNKVLSNLRIVLPSNAEQTLIVDRISDLYKQSSNLESIYQQKLTALAELKQSLLQKAFSGELTAEAEPIMEEVVA